MRVPSLVVIVVIVLLRAFALLHVTALCVPWLRRYIGRLLPGIGSCDIRGAETDIAKADGGKAYGVLCCDS